MLTKELRTVKVLTYIHTQIESSSKLDLVNMPKNILYELVMYKNT